jgi:hypothetical protein
MENEDLDNPVQNIVLDRFMTRDELLFLINKTGAEASEANPWIARVELHKPIHSCVEHKQCAPYVCIFCNIDYPCDTVTAIENEL